MTVSGLGNIEVRTLGYSERRALFGAMKTEDDASDAYQTEFMLLLLATTTSYPDGKPCGNSEEWNMFSGRYTDAAISVFKKACDLNGFTPEVVEKN